METRPSALPKDYKNVKVAIVESGSKRILGEVIFDKCIELTAKNQQEIGGPNFSAMVTEYSNTMCHHIDQKTTKFLAKYDKSGSYQID